MEGAELVEQVLGALTGATPDLLDHVLTALDGNQVDLSALSEDVLVDTVLGALVIVGGAAVTGAVEAHRPQVVAAVRRGLAGS